MIASAYSPLLGRLFLPLLAQQIGARPPSVSPATQLIGSRPPSVSPANTASSWEMKRSRLSKTHEGAMVARVGLRKGVLRFGDRGRRECLDLDLEWQGKRHGKRGLFFFRETKGALSLR